MKSPFAIFRKHQKLLMAALTGLAMVAFVLLDQNLSGAQFLVILCGLLGAALFAIFGRRSGETVKYAVVGAFVGALAGFFLPSSAGPRPAVETDVRSLSHDELKHLVERRRNANGFLQAAYEKVSPFPGDNPYLRQWWEQQLNSVMFGFGRSRNDITEDVILGFLLEIEADEIGLTVSDGAVSDYINRATNRKLTAADYKEILSASRQSESQVFDAIRGELRAKLAMETLVPRASPTPEQYWEQYLKLGQSQSLEVAEVPVDAFVDAAPEPTPEQLSTFFEQWKVLLPPGRGLPGLRQPRRVRIEYLAANFDEAETETEAASPVADDEVKKYYAEHIEDYRLRPRSGATTPNDGSDPFAGPALEPPAGGSKDAAPKASPADAVPPAPEKKAEPKPPAEPQEKKTDDKKNSDAKKSGASRDARSSGDVFAEIVSGDETLEFVAFQPAGKAAGEPGPPPTPVQPGKAASDGGNAAAAGKRVPIVAQPPAPQLEFRPLDDFLQKEIRERILTVRTKEAMKAKIQAAHDFMAPLRDQLISADLQAPPKMSAEERVKQLRDYAARHKLTYALMPPLSIEELHESETEYPIAAAAEPMDDVFSTREPVDVVRQLFVTPPAQVFQPYTADDRATRFAYWKVEDVDEHVPTLEEPGMRERAVRAWKIAEHAQKSAKDRAEELAELVRKSKQPMAEALAGQTVTKQEKGAAVIAVPTAPFSWVTVPSAAPRDLMSDTMPRLSTISGVKDAGDAFMKTVFQEMNVGDVRAVPNQGPSSYYVVTVKSRHPADAEEMNGFRERFLKENLFGGNFMTGGRSTYDYLTMPEQQRTSFEWLQRLNAKYNVRRDQPEPRGSRSPS